MLKWYLRIYIFIEYLNCVCKSNCIWIIRNDSKKEKKKSEDRVPGSGLGQVRWRGPSHVNLVNISTIDHEVSF